MNVSAIFFAIAALCFLLAVLGASIGEVALVPLGLLFVAVAFVLERVGVGAGVGHRDRT